MVKYSIKIKLFWELWDEGLDSELIQEKQNNVHLLWFVHIRMINHWGFIGFSLLPLLQGWVKREPVSLRFPLSLAPPCCLSESLLVDSEALKRRPLGPRSQRDFFLYTTLVYNKCERLLISLGYSLESSKLHIIHYVFMYFHTFNCCFNFHFSFLLLTVLDAVLHFSLFSIL